MKKLTQKQVLILAGVFVTVFLLTFFFGPATGRQMRRLSKAREHIAKIEPAIKADSRFKHVIVGPCTGGGGMLGVFGAVESKQDLSALKKIIDESQPPVEVLWQVDVIAGVLRIE